jgi:hypothetical protein
MSAESTEAQLVRIESARLRRPRPLGSLTASAQRLTAARLKSGPGRQTDKGWQQDAWDMYDLVGEERFLANTLAGRMSQARFYIGKLTDDPQEEPVPVNDPRLQRLLDSVGQTGTGLAQMILRMGVNLFVAGDCWLVGIPENLLPTDGDEQVTGPPPMTETGDLAVDALEWHAMSISEVSSSGAGELTIRLGPNVEEQIKCSPDDVQLIRVWRPHPRLWWEADSPTRSSLPVLRELVGLTMHISAQVDSRLAGAGLLIVPASAQRSLRQAAGLGDMPDETDANEPDPFTEALMEAMLTPIGDRASASALVPLVVTVPDEVTGSFNFMSFSKPLDSEARSLRDEAIRRLALGQDAPPELLLGTAGMNHWGAWLVREDVITTHVEPPLALIADALTTQFLWPALVELGLSDPKDYVVWYDVSHMIVRPNRSQDAMNLYDRGTLSDESLRDATGFDEADAPETDELDQATAMAFEIVKANPSLFGFPGLASIIKQVRGALTGTPTTAPGATEQVGETPPPPDIGTGTPPTGSGEPSGEAPATAGAPAPANGGASAP